MSLWPQIGKGIAGKKTPDAPFKGLVSGYGMGIMGTPNHPGLVPYLWSPLMHVLIVLSPTQRSMFISPRGKRRLQVMMDMADRHGWAWRYHDGNGWADESPSAALHIQSITEPCMATIVY